MSNYLKNTSEEGHSSYLQYLPSLYREDDFCGRFLRIFEDVLTPIEGIIDKLAFYFDPGTTPQSFLPWLACWVGLVLDERWPELRRRELLKAVVELYRWRGTKRGLTEYLRIYTGVSPQIIEPTGITPMRLGDEARLGAIQLGGAEEQPYCFTVVVNVDDVTAIDTEIVRTIIETQKPAHTTYVLKIVEEKSKI